MTENPMANLNLFRPSSGQHSVFHSTGNEAVILNFPAGEATLGREGEALTFTFDDGGTLALEGFYTTYTSSNVPEFLVDGQALSGKEFFAALGHDDLMPAAGPAGVERGARYNEFAESSLAEGVDHLDGLDWQMQPLFASETEFPAEGLLAASGGGGDTPGPGPDPDGGTYHTRLVMSHGSGQSLSFQAVDENGHLVTDASKLSFAFAGGVSQYFNPPSVDPATGLVTVTLTEAGKAALAAGGKFASTLEVSIGGKTYTMDLLGSGGTSTYDYTQREAEAGMDGPLKGEWYVSHGKIVSGETITLGGDSINNILVVNARDSGNAYATHNTEMTFAHDTVGRVDIAAKAEGGGAYGNYIQGYGGNAAGLIDAGTKADVHISASSGTGTAMAMATSSEKAADGSMYETSAVVRGRDISFSANATEKMAAGIWGSGKTTVNVEAQGDVNFSSVTKGGTVDNMSTGVYTRDQAIVNISGQNVSSEAKALAGGGADGTVTSSGFRTSAGTSLNITTAENGTFNASSYQETSPYDSPYSGVSWTGGRAAGFTSMGLTASGNVDQGGWGNKSHLNVKTGDVNISATVDASSGKGTAAGIYAGYGGNVNINTSDNGNELNISGHAPSWGVGITSTNHGITHINAGDGDDVININASAHNGAAAIGLATQAGGTTVIDGGGGNDTVNINATFTGTKTLSTDYMDVKGGAFGMNAAWGTAVNKITNVNNVNITADASGSDNGWAYGMFTRDGWGTSTQNIIENSDSPITVVITAKAGTAGEAYAMYGNAGGLNLIQGGSKAGDEHGDNITLTGNVGGYVNVINTGSGNDHIEINGDLRGADNTFNMGGGNDAFTLNGNITGGANRILMGDGDDRVVINGSVTGGSTTINLGTGNDTVVLDGHVKGGLSIISGEGHDLLVLKADSFDDFMDKYDAWLQGNISKIQVEEINVSVNGLSDADRASLEDYFNSDHFNGYQVGFVDGAAAAAAYVADDMPDVYREAGLTGNEHDSGGGVSGQTEQSYESVHTDSVSDDTGTLVAQQQIASEFGG